MNASKTLVLLLVVLAFGCGRSTNRPAGRTAKRDMTPEEMTRMITVEDLNALVRAPGDRAVCTRAKATKRPDGKLILTYEYDSTRDASSPSLLYVECDLDVCPTLSSAETSYRTAIVGTEGGVMSRPGSGARLVNRDELMTLGDESHVSQFEVDGRPKGTLLFVRRGKEVLTLNTVGVYFDQRRVLERLVSSVFNKEGESD